MEIDAARRLGAAADDARDIFEPCADKTFERRGLGVGETAADPILDRRDAQHRVEEGGSLCEVMGPDLRELSLERLRDPQVERLADPPGVGPVDLEKVGYLNRELFAKVFRWFGRRGRTRKTLLLADRFAG